MKVHPKVYALHKSGNAVEEYEDAHGWSAERDAPRFRCAVADGATEASFSKLWADKLVRAYCAGDFDATVFAARLEGLQQEWLREVSAAAAGMPQQQWYVEEKLRQGAFSALVGLTLQPVADVRAEGIWNAFAIGDCCLFQVRRDALVVRFPIGRAEDFNNRPFLVSSNPAGNHSLVEHMHPFTGTWETGDCFYLVSDALAQWFLQTHERGGRPWHTLGALRNDTDEAFASLVARLRASHELRNDDVTALEFLVD